MSKEQSKKTDKKQMPTSVLLTLIICATILLLTVAGMVFSGVFMKHFNANDFMPDTIHVNSSSSKMKSDDKKDDGYVGKTKAKEAALSDAKVIADDLKYFEIYLDNDGGQMKYEIEFATNDFEYDYEVDAVTGAIIDSEREARD